MIRRPLPDAEIVELFGDPWQYTTPEGSGRLAWETRILVLIPLPAPLPLSWNLEQRVNRVRCHYRIARTLTDAFEALHASDELWGSLNDFAGCYEFRAQRKARAISRHSWGIALDLDSLDNPFGAPPQMHPGVVEVFEKYGFCWGGHFGAARVDGMHFEIADPAVLTAA